MNCAVCDTGPLTHLWQIELWSSFRAFMLVHVAEQVLQEIAEHVAVDRFPEIVGYPLTVHPVTLPDLAEYQAFFREKEIFSVADMATFVLAQHLKPQWVLTDDLLLRQMLEQAGQQPMGSVGLVLYAYKVGLLNRQTLEQAIDRLFVHSTLYLSPQFKTYVQHLIAERIG